MKRLLHHLLAQATGFVSNVQKAGNAMINGRDSEALVPTNHEYEMEDENALQAAKTAFEMAKDDYEYVQAELEFTRESSVMLLVWVISIAMFLVLFGNSLLSVFFRNADLQPRLTIPILGVFAVAGVTLISIRYYRALAATRQARNKVNECEKRLGVQRQLTPKERLAFLQEETLSQTKRSGQVYFRDPERYKQVREAREEAGEILKINSDKPNHIDLEVLDNCRYALYRLSELTRLEEKEQRDERRWQRIAFFVVVIYIGIILGVAFNPPENPQTIVVEPFGIPLTIVIWGAIGSVAAILYKFYKIAFREESAGFAREIRWLFARPLIGVIMSGLAYLSIKTGFLLLGQPDGTSAIPDHIEVYWIVAFLAGFSDKLYLRIIDLLVARIGAKENEAQGNKETNPPVEGKPQSEYVVS